MGAKSLPPSVISAAGRHDFNASRDEALGYDLAAATGTSLDKGAELDASAKLPSDKRKGLIDRARAAEAAEILLPIRATNSVKC